MKRVKLACCNFLGVSELRRFALENGFAGIEWTFTPEDLPWSPAEQSSLLRSISKLRPLEVRYHCAFSRVDLGDEDREKAENAMSIFQHACRLVSELEGHHVTLHVGLGRDSTMNLSWDRTVRRLTELVRFADSLGVRICLENLAWGWTSRPELFEKLIRKSGCWATLDIGHLRVSPSVTSQHYEIEDFVIPHPERFLGAHIYHEEDMRGHIPAGTLLDMKRRLDLLGSLPSCDWWVLELREKSGLLSTLRVVREYLELEGNGNPGI